MSEKIKDGPFKEYHENGQLRLEGTYNNGKKDGLWKWYYLNGKLEGEGTYKDGQHHGTSKTYHDNGSPEDIREFEYGSLVSWKVYHRRGYIKEEYRFDGGKVVDFIDYRDDY